MAGLPPRAIELLRLAHARPGLTRADAGRELGIGSGMTSTLVAQLKDDALLAEAPVDQTGVRGRPTMALVPHPDGPLVGVAIVSHRGWCVQAVELGGRVVAQTVGGVLSAPDGAAVVRQVRQAIKELDEQMPGRMRAAGVAVPGPVRDNRWVKATLLDWGDQDVQSLWEADDTDDEKVVPLLVVGNDATLAAVGEARRGSARGARTHLHLFLDIGMGGGVTHQGVAVEGAQGAAGEFGHLPFGDPAQECPCGAYGCWGKTLDGDDLARRLGDPLPDDPVAYSAMVLDRADAGNLEALAAVRAQATSLGRGAAGLVNALDPALVTLSGLAARLLVVEPGAVHEAYRRGLMSFRRVSPPPLVVGPLGDDAPLVGASEEVWGRLWSRIRENPRG